MGLSLYVQVGRWSYWIGAGFTRTRKPPVFVGAGREREDASRLSLGVEWVIS